MLNRLVVSRFLVPRIRPPILSTRKESSKEDEEKCEIHPCEEARISRPKFVPLSKVVVTLVGASDPVAKIVALQLKQSCLVKEVRLFDFKPIHGFATDLKHINTPTRVIGFVGDSQIKYALKKSDIVVIIGGKQSSPSELNSNVFDANAKLVKELAYACLRGAPDSIYVITTEPVNSMVPLFAEVFKQNGVFCPNKLLGSMALETMRIRTMTASKLGLDPSTVKASVIGGASPQTMVPIVSGATPGGIYLLSEAKSMIKSLKNMNETITMAKKGKPPLTSSGYALALYIETIARGLCDLDHDSFPAVVRTNTVDGVTYLATPLRYGLLGVKENLGLPKLSELEMELLEAAIPHLRKDIERGESFATKRDKPCPSPEYVKRLRKEICPPCCPLPGPT